jgi:cold shock CspA family protein
MSSDKDVTLSASEQLIGRVKWFNNKAGYGFITVTDGPRSGSDIFVHHSTIMVDDQQYKYLIQGEYVDFGIVKSTSGDHEYQSINVHGIKGGKLMCETRHELKISRSAYKNFDEQERPRQQRGPRGRGEGPRGRGGDEHKSWTVSHKKDEIRSNQQTI